MFNGKTVLVTGGTGLIGRPLVEMLLDRGAKVRIASLDSPNRANPNAEFFRTDLTQLDNCIKVTQGVDIVFHLAGIKGSPAMTAQKPASFFYPTISFNTQMLEAARLSNVKKYLFTSSIGVYSPSEVFYEEEVWSTFPSENDRFAGWAKRMGELQLDAYRIEYGWNDLYCVRPANVYGTYDNFDTNNAMVIPSLIKRALMDEDSFTAWGDGSAIRDFIHAKDVARGMIKVMEKDFQKPVNLGSGVGVSIKDLVHIILKNIDSKKKLIWDTSKPSGDKKRILSVTRAESLDIFPEVSLEEGLREVIIWYKQNRAIVEERYNVFR